MNKKSGNKLLVILGPTSSGKSDLAVRLAKKLNGEVVSADSRQVYRGLNIATGKITHAEMRGVKHHLLDVANPRKQFTVHNYKNLADKAIANILKRGKLPIICGGTGFYIDAVLDNAQFPAAKADRQLREKLAKKSLGELSAMLRKLDRKRWREINANRSEKKNTRRLIRAIEIASNKRKNPLKMMSNSNLTEAVKYEPIIIGIKMESDELKRRIHNRLVSRLKRGMVTEVIRLHGRGLSWKRMEELGLEYRIISKYLRGMTSKEEMTRLIEIGNWQYARRQMTWFKRNRKIQWFTTGNEVDKYVFNKLDSSPD